MVKKLKTKIRNKNKKIKLQREREALRRLQQNHSKVFPELVQENTINYV